MIEILIADDNRQITSILEEYAKKEGYTVSLAFDGIQAINMFKNKSFDVILMEDRKSVV